MLIAVLGLGEAGAAIAAGLGAEGVAVRGYDPAGVQAPDGVEIADDPASAVEGAAAVLSLNSAAAALGAATGVASALAPEALFADLNTTAPQRQREIADALGDAASRFADVALVGPVPGNGLRTPALVSGPGAARFAEIFGPLGMPVTEVGAEPGDAAARKLARSVFAKGLAAAIGESLAAAERLGCEEWLHADLERTLQGADERLLQRLIDGSRTHASRRVEEMEAAVAMLGDLGLEPRVATAARDWLQSLAAEGAGDE
jgi:3-hydroxyisobutyrate dehydrogenase-like beta-hydroxyacid dehydrogenase